MMVTTKTIVTFFIPDEQNLIEEFKATNDMSEWVEGISTQAVTYTKTKTFATEKHEVNDEDNEKPKQTD